MNKKTKKNNGATNGKLSFKRETVRTLSPAESANVVGGKMCLPESCGGRTCPGSVCTITVDETL